MATTTVINQNNVPIPVAPPEFFFPSAAGQAVPAGQKSWQALFDTTGLPNGVLMARLIVEFKRHAWTDKAGGVHPEGEWLPDLGPDSLMTGPTGKGSMIVPYGSSIGAVDQGGGMVEPYPTNVRLHVLLSNGITVPNIKLNLST